MKHIKKFRRITESLEPRPTWEPYLKELFVKFLKIWEEEFLSKEDLYDFFSKVEEELDESDEQDVWIIEKLYSRSQPATLIGLVRAYGQYHAALNLALALQCSFIVEDLFGDYNSIEIWQPEESEIKSKVENLKIEIEKWTTIY